MKSDSSLWLTQDLMCYLYLSQTEAGGSVDRQGNLNFNAIELISDNNLLVYYSPGHCRQATKLFF